ncbi:MAG: hypothetical protein JKY01_09005 [Pseudomonadales bacterium]|nr:hypothetical protein [Pseudomonadales bacterium]
MINLLLGQPGGGKSYEAVAFHIIPAIQEGRKVITNLPLNLDYFEKVYPKSVDLINIIQNKGVIRAFSTAEFYGDDWRHPGTGTGPPYIIDECHFCLRRGKTSQEVEEWFSMHRHELADVLLITQSYGKVDKNIIDLVQLCYRVKKATAFGTEKKYIRKVQDGVRGEVMNTEFRNYEKHIFPFYKSHTRSNKSAAEAVASDVKPFWKSWTVIIAASFILFGIPLSISSFTSMSDKTKNSSLLTQKEMAIAQPQTHRISPQKIHNQKSDNKDSPETKAKLEEIKIARAQLKAESEKERDRRAKAEKSHPYTGLQIHLQGVMRWNNSKDQVIHFVASQNASIVFGLTDKDLSAAGYTFVLKNHCLGILAYGDYSKAITCNSPSHGMQSTKSIMTRES